MRKFPPKSQEFEIKIEIHIRTITMTILRVNDDWREGESFQEEERRGKGKGKFGMRMGKLEDTFLLVLMSVRLSLFVFPREFGSSFPLCT